MPTTSGDQAIDYLIRGLRSAIDHSESTHTPDIWSADEDPMRLYGACARQIQLFERLCAAEGSLGSRILLGNVYDQLRYIRTGTRADYFYPAFPAVTREVMSQLELLLARHLGYEMEADLQTSLVEFGSLQLSQSPGGSVEGSLVVYDMTVDGSMMRSGVTYALTLPQPEASMMITAGEDQGAMRLIVLFLHLKLTSSLLSSLPSICMMQTDHLTVDGATRATATSATMILQGSDEAVG